MFIALTSMMATIYTWTFVKSSNHICRISCHPGGICLGLFTVCLIYLVDNTLLVYS